MKKSQFLRYLIVCVLLISWGCDSKKESLKETKPSKNPNNSVDAPYLVKWVEGEVEHSNHPKGPWEPVLQNDSLTFGSFVRSGHGSSALIVGSQGDKIMVMELSKIILNPEFLRKFGKNNPGELSKRGVQLLSGKLWLDVAKEYGRFEVKTPDFLVKVDGTLFSVVHKGAQNQVSLHEGSVRVIAHQKSGQEYKMKPGQILELSNLEGPKKSPIIRELTTLERETPSFSSPASGLPDNDTLGSGTLGNSPKTSAPSYQKLPKKTNYEKVEKSFGKTKSPDLLEKERKKANSSLKNEKKAYAHKKDSVVNKHNQAKQIARETFDLKRDSVKNRIASKRDSVQNRLDAVKNQEDSESTKRTKNKAKSAFDKLDDF